jgi:hypothetical protein
MAKIFISKKTTKPTMKFPKIGTPPKFLLWFTLGFFSSSMAEVLSSSHPQGIFDLWGIMVIFPLYTLHILVLSGILFKIGINWQRLFLFGCVFGMYEGYITKVFWDPFWGPEEFEVLGVYWFQFSTLVFFWHAFFAFILPLLVVERFFTSSSFVLDSVKKFPLLNKLSRRTAVLPLTFGLVQSSNTSAETTITFGVANLITLVAITLLFKKLYKNQMYSIDELLPKGRDLKILTLMLIAFYIFWTFVLRYESIGDIKSQLVVLLMYLIFGIAIIKSSDHNEHLKEVQENHKHGFRPLYIYYTTYLASAITFVMISAVLPTFPITIAFLLLGTAYGIALFLIVLRFLPPPVIFLRLKSKLKRT